MNKSDISDRMADRMGLGKSAARDAVDSVFEAIGEALANGEEVRIAGFGTFGARSRAARTGRNPADRRGAVDTGFDGAGIQGGQGTPGCREGRKRVVGLGMALVQRQTRSGTPGMLKPGDCGTKTGAQAESAWRHRESRQVRGFRFGPARDWR